MRERILNTIGFGLLAVCFVVALGRTLWPKPKTESGENVVTIRIAHWQLEGGVREAIDAMARAYEAEHPGVRVVQIPIPERIYTNWLITQLVGGTAPDIIQIGIGISDERLSRFFVPLTGLAEEPNPYNKGTDLEGIPLRDTIFDGMRGGYNEALIEFYGVPLSGTSIRAYYNLDLLKKVTGSEKLPTNFREFIELCKKVEDYSQKTGEILLPIAASRYNGPQLMERLFDSQTQKLVQRENPVGTLEFQPTLTLRRYAEGDWDMRTPELLSGFELMRAVANYMQPGFMQLQRDDATFYFVQGRTLMITSGSWDSTSIRSQAPFRVGIAPIPAPTRDDPEYGEFILGPLSEAGSLAAVSFGLTRGSPHPKVAKDFLLFMASQRINKIWTDVSGWLPSVVGVEPHPSALPFKPIMEGYPSGLNLAPTPDLKRIWATNAHLLFGPEGSAERFAAAMERDFLRASTSDLRRQLTSIELNGKRSDTVLAALAVQAGDHPDDRATALKLDLAIQAAATNDRNLQSTRAALKASEQALNSQP
ncbi:MAG: extracellular solute-binding protein [Terrimicrobiaceae bacterium]|nr:extracellular solute-binding protein [Terrimicrobiaceae bacterium]